MEREYWHKQTTDAPLFPDLLWSRPENKRLAGKLLILGGSASGFKAPAEAYAAALAAGIGTARVILPASLERTVAGIFPEAEFAKANTSGSFASSALADLVDAADWAEGVLVAGNCGKSSETQIMLERFIHKYNGQLTMVGDCLDLFLAQPEQVLTRPGTTLAPSLGQLQKLAATGGIAITSQMGLIQLVEKLHELSEKHPASIITGLDEQILAAAGGQVSSTPGSSSLTKLAASASVWTLQNPDRTFPALGSSSLNL